MTMTREEFEDWLEERRDAVLDSVPQRDASARIWVERLYAGLKLLSKASKAEVEERDEEEAFDQEDADADANDGDDDLDRDYEDEDEDMDEDEA